MIEVKALACQLPAELGLPLSKLQVSDLRRAVLDRGLVAAIGDTTIWRWLHEDAIKPWQHRSWIFPRDPAFEAKTTVVLDLYQRRFREQPLRPDEYVISADEKTSPRASPLPLPPNPSCGEGSCHVRISVILITRSGGK